MPKKKMGLGKALTKATKIKKPTEPVWKGPEVDGVTQSLLSLFLVCKERFRLKVIEGWTTPDEFVAPLEYGNMWHLCEEMYAASKGWRKPLFDYSMILCKKYKLQQEQVVKWYTVCLVQFPIYLEYWKNTKDMKNRKPILQETSFCVPYKLPSGRVVKLRGKWDGVDLDTSSNSLVLQENKTKGTINQEQMQRNLSFDLQLMVYIIALREHQKANPFLQKKTPGATVGRVRYNVVRRPLSGGKGSIRPHKATKTKPAETAQNYYARLGGIIADNPEEFFMRWDVSISKKDMQTFEQQFLIPCLEHLCEWYDCVAMPGLQHFLGAIHYRTPYGIYNPIAERRATDMDELLLSGSTVGLVRTDNLFPEL